VHLVNPVAWVLRHKADSTIPRTRQVITHGDLHGDNLFVDGTHAWAIDFERSGPGPILRDFVELEVDIITRLVRFPEDNWRLFDEFVRVLAEPLEAASPLQPTPNLQADAETRKALGVITGLREIAREVTHYTDAREYLWGLLLDALFVAMLIPPPSPQRDRALLLGAVLCERLGS
jgi:Ternary complex associated domain 9